MRPSRISAGVAIGGAALLMGTLVVPTPASAATTDFKSFCLAQAPIVGEQPKLTTNSMTVTAPASVDAGQEFTYRIQPGAGSYPDKKSAPVVGSATVTGLSRIKYDYEIPNNATFVSARVVDGTGVNLSGTAPNVLRVNEAGQVAEDGDILRLSGNNQVVGNSPTSSTNSEGGVVIPKTKAKLDGSASDDGSTWFRMPAIEVTLKAGSFGTIQPKVRTANGADTRKDARNFNTQLAKASALGTQWTPTYCTPRDSDNAPLNAGGGPLANIQINAAPVDAQTTTSLTVPGTATTGDAVPLKASVAPNPGGGAVQFKSNGTNIGSPVAVTAGKAELSHTFNTAGDKSVTAVFSGSSGFVGSTSAAKTITVSAPEPMEVDTTVKVVAPASAKNGAQVELKAQLTPADLNGGTVQFKVNGDNVGAPVAVTAGVAKLDHAFATAGSYTVTAVYSGTSGHSGSISGPTIVVVSSDPVDPVDPVDPTDPSDPSNPGTGGSGSLSGFGSLG